MSFSKPKFVTSFLSLNLAQFMAALNDNFYKLLLVFFLISTKGEEHSNTILSLAGAIFVIPFLLFAATAGSLADRLSKQKIIYFTRILEILTTALGVLFFFLKSAVGGYLVLFLMASQSAIFSPCKYGIIPEIVPKRKISHYNGILTATTYLAIIFGTFAASFLTEITHKNFIFAAFFCVIFAVLGLVFSLGIEKTQPQSAEKKISSHFISDIFRSLVKAKKTRYLLTTILFGAYFLFMGAYTQLNIIPFALQSLGLSDVHGGYLFLMTAIGIGIGAYLAGKLSGKEIELGFIPLATFGVTLCFLGLFLLQNNLYLTAILLTLTGVFGGFFAVPVDAYIQFASPNDERGANLAAANFLSFLGVVVASFLIAFLGNVLKLSAAEGFLIISLVTFLMGLSLMLLYADQVIRLFAATFAKMFWNIKIVGKYRADLTKATLIVAPRSSWMDTLIVMAALPRFIRYIVPISPSWGKRLLFYPLLQLIPLDSKKFSPIGDEAIKAIESEIKEGHSVCLMHPIDIPSNTLKEWEEKLAEVLKSADVPLIPLHISKKMLKKSNNEKELAIRVYYGKTIPSGIT